MAEDNKNLIASITELGNKLAEAGVPGILLGPAGKALSRLIGGVADIPAAWLEQKAQNIRNETNARSNMMDKLTDGSIAIGLQDPVLLERGLNNMLHKVYREQSNREAVASKTIEHLKEGNAGENQTVENAGPSDDWMDTFSDHASKASSEDMRDLFARILAGEIRKPESISRQTLNLASLLDVNTAKLIEKILPHVWNENVIFSDIIDNMIYTDMLDLNSIGYLQPSEMGLTLTMRVLNNTIHFRNGNRIISVRNLTGNEVVFNNYRLTRAGKELSKAIAVEPDYMALKQSISKTQPDAEFVLQTIMVKEPDGRLRGTEAIKF